MAVHHQMLMYLHHKEDFFFSSTIDTIGLKEVSIESLPENFQTLIRDKCLMLTNKLAEVRGIIFHGQKYFSGAAVVLSRHDKTCEFGEIVTVFISNDVPHLMCNRLDILCFDNHYNSYCTRRICDSYTLVRVSDLPDYHPLGIYHLNKQMFIPLHHYVPVK